MADGFGYIDDRGEFAFDGFAIVLQGVDGQFELVPVSLLYPELGNEPGNIVRMTARLRAGAYVAEEGFDFPFSVIYRLLADVDAWLYQKADIEFPNPQVVQLLESYCRCQVVRSTPNRDHWLLICELSSGQDQSRKTMNARLRFDHSSVGVTRRELENFIFVSGTAKQNSN